MNAPPPRPSALIYRGMTTTETTEDDAATLRDAADTLRRHMPDAVDALAVLELTADMLDPEAMEEAGPSDAAVAAARREAYDRGIGDPHMARVSEYRDYEDLRRADAEAERLNLEAWRAVLTAAMKADQ